MLSTIIKEEDILTALRQLEPRRWFEVMDFIGYLRNQTAQPVSAITPAPTKIMTAADLLQSSLVGIWADRDDIGDSVAFARKLRHQAEQRQREPYAAS
jgi:hypothetical protein